MKIKNAFLFVLACAIASLAIGQPSNYQFSAPPPQRVQQGNAVVVGAQGQQGYNYYVIANYPRGKAAASVPIVVLNVPVSVSMSNYVRINWTAPSNQVSSYDLIRTVVNAPPPNPNSTCANCLVASGITATTYNNTSNTLTSYTLNSIGGASGSIALQNQGASTPQMVFNIVPNGSYVFNGSLTCTLTPCGTGGSGSPGGSNGQTQYNNSGAFGGYTMGKDCTIDVTTGNITCTATNGTPFAASATTDTTNAANITSGSLPDARLSANVVLTTRANTYGAFANDFHLTSMRLAEKTVSGLPTASSNTNNVYVVTDGTSASDCTTGGSTTRALCISNGTAWVALGGGAGGAATTVAVKNIEVLAPSSASGTAYVATAVTAPTSLGDMTGTLFDFKPDVTNTSTTPTLNVNGLGAKTIINSDGTAVAIGQLVGGKYYPITYDGTNLQLISSIPYLAGTGIVLTGTTFSVDCTTVVGCQGSANNFSSSANTYTGRTDLTCTNAASTGTTANLLAKNDGAGGCVLATTADVYASIYGPVASGAGTTGSARVPITGVASCVADVTVTAGHYVTIGSVTNGRCGDSGASTPPTSGTSFLGVWNTSGSAGTVQSYNIFKSQNSSGGSSQIVTQLGVQSGTALSGGTDTTIVQSASIPANTIPTGGCLEVKWMGLLAPVSSNPVTIKMWFGSAATTGASIAYSSIASTVAVSPLGMVAYICNDNGSLVAQHLATFAWYAQVAGGSAAQATGSQNTGTTGMIVSISGAASAGETVTSESFTVTKLF